MGLDLVNEVRLSFEKQIYIKTIQQAGQVMEVTLLFWGKQNKTNPKTWKIRIPNIGCIPKAMSELNYRTHFWERKSRTPSHNIEYKSIVKTIWQKVSILASSFHKDVMKIPYRTFHLKKKKKEHFISVCYTNNWHM